MHGALLFRMLAAKPSGRLPYLATPAKAEAREQRRIDKQKRERMTSAVLQILDKGEPTRFAFEGAVRHGLRSGFCADGAGWHDADALAASIIKEALRRLGVSRPTWEMGQPEHAQYAVVRVEHYFCAHCGRPLDNSDERIVGKKYCGAACRTSASSRPRDQRVSRAEWLAQCVAKTTIACDHCGKPFNHGGRLLRRFCSRACSAAAYVIAKERPARACEHCGTKFRVPWSGDEQRYCSISCGQLARRAKARAAKPKRHCQQCGAELTKRDQKAFCSRECANEFRFHRPNGFACEPVAAE